MIDKKDMLVKVASYDKATCVLANTVIAYKEMMAKKAADPTVAPSNAYFNTAADLLAEQPTTNKRMITGAGIGLIAGLLGGAAFGRPAKAKWNDMRLPKSITMPIGGIYGAGIGAAGASLLESIRLGNKAKESVEKYRGKIPWC